MESRALGSSGLETPALMLGGNVFGWTADRDASFAVLDAFAAGGGTLIDSADIYSAWVPGNQGGESERMLGEWFRASGRRQSMLVATKVGMLPGTGGEGLRPSRIAAACDESLERLGTDVIDLYFAHKDDPDTPLEEALEAFDKLIRAGKVRAIGASNFTAERLAEALAISDANGWARFTVIEPHYNLVERAGYEGALQDLTIAEGLGAVPYFGLGSGYLTGKYRSEADVAGSAREKWVRPVFEGKGPAVLAAMDEIAAETGADLAAIALAWLRAQPGVSAPIASATNVKQVEGLLAGLDLTLSGDQVTRLDDAGRAD
jgi:aryl-alcohol dehydrogenase-like predicted oxidoreductase